MILKVILRLSKLSEIQYRGICDC